MFLNLFFRCIFCKVWRRNWNNCWQCRI